MINSTSYTAANVYDRIEWCVIVSHSKCHYRNRRSISIWCWPVCVCVYVHDLLYGEFPRYDLHLNLVTKCRTTGRWLCICSEFVCVFLCLFLICCLLFLFTILCFVSHLRLHFLFQSFI